MLGWVKSSIPINAYSAHRRVGSWIQVRNGASDSESSYFLYHASTSFQLRVSDCDWVVAVNV